MRQLSNAPLKRVHVDLLGPLSNNGNVYVLMVVDKFPKWVECYAIPNQTPETVSRCYLTISYPVLGDHLDPHEGRQFGSEWFM